MFSFVVGWIHSCGTQRYRRLTATPWINLKNIMLSEGSQTQEHIRHDSVHMKSPDKAKFIGTESKLVVPVDSVVIICLHCRRQGRHGFDPWGGKISWRRKWQPTPVFLPGKSHGQRSLVRYRPGSCKRVGQNWATEHLKTEVGMRSDHMCSWQNFGGSWRCFKIGVRWKRTCVHVQSCPTLCDPRLLRPWGFPGKNAGVGHHFLLHGIFLSQGSNPRLLPWQANSLPLSHLGSQVKADSSVHLSEITELFLHEPGGF